ncbi:MAG: hypothetical protein ACUVXI_06120 [bacterium]
MRKSTVGGRSSVSARPISHSNASEVIFRLVHSLLRGRRPFARDYWVWFDLWAYYVLWDSGLVPISTKRRRRGSRKPQVSSIGWDLIRLYFFSDSERTLGWLERYRDRINGLLRGVISAYNPGDERVRDEILGFLGVLRELGVDLRAYIDPDLLGEISARDDSWADALSAWSSSGVETHEFVPRPLGEGGRISE